MFELLLKNNALPYIIMVVVIYFAMDYKIRKDIEISNLEATTELQFENAGTIQAYNELQFEELRKVKQTKWVKGKHEKVITYSY